MKVTITEAAAKILAQPHVPVMLLDTCVFIDLFRGDEKRIVRRVPVEEVQVALELMDLVSSRPNAVHLYVPELVPHEYLDNANKEQTVLNGWIEAMGESQEWLAKAAASFGYLQQPFPVAQQFSLDKNLRDLADRLLGAFHELDRDQGCLNRAVARLIDKRRPSHRNMVKDSMNLEQCLELSRQLQAVGFKKPRVWVSSNTGDFADNTSASQPHADLQSEFASAGLLFFTSLRAAYGNLRANGQF